MTIASTNPATGETLKTFPPDSDGVIEEKLRKAAAAAKQWRRTTFAERAQRMSRAAVLLEQRKDALARLMTLEMGKLRRAGVAEIEKCATGCRYYVENAERHLAPEPVKTDARRSEKRFQPLGPVLAIMPWNFPFWQVFRFAAPALMAGNVGCSSTRATSRSARSPSRRSSATRASRRAPSRRCWSAATR